MAAYAAVVSLVQLLHPHQFSLHHRNEEIESLYRQISSLQSVLEKITPVTKNIRNEVHTLNNNIREEIYIAQDTIETFIFSQSLSPETPLDDSPTSSFSQKLREIIANIDPLATEAEKIALSIQKDQQIQDPSSTNAQPFKPSSTIKSTKIVGQEKDFERVKAELIKDENQLQVVPVIGLPGIGKTTLARSLYDDEKVRKEFNNYAWVTVSQDYQVGEIFSKLMNSMETKNRKAGETEIQAKTDLRDQLYQHLYNTKYLIVVDDMWDIAVWDKIKSSFPDNRNGSRILLTTRIKEIAQSAGSTEFLHKMEPLSLELSWDLLTRKVFGDEVACPLYLKETGLKIAEHCGGLPLSLTVIGGLLSQEEMTDKYWKDIEEDTHAAAARGNESYLEILFLSYNHLPGRLKGCFLYMGAFPEDSEILVTKLVKLWVAEGFLKPAQALSPLRTWEEVAKEYLQNLIDRNLLSIRKFTSNSVTKACGMHDTLRDLAVQECGKEKFFHSRRKYTQDTEQGRDDQRRLSVHRNILMCMEEVYDSVKTITPARTILYASSHHHHPMPFCLTFDLLRVLDAFTCYFIEFPNEILKLIHLRYLSLTYNGKLSSELSNLTKLQILILRRHPKIIFLGTSFLPDEIWNMPELRHLLFTECDLPRVPPHDSILLENLQSLSNVSAASCTKEVLQNMPNLKKLGMWTEAPGVVDLHLDQVPQLESFKFAVLNPIPKKKIDFQPKFYFPNTLVKLRLSGCSIPWEDMTVIGLLPCLEVLKLREIAFQGDKWSPGEDAFRKLKFLLLEYLDLKHWNAKDSNFPKLESLILRHCYELEEIPLDIGLIGCLKLIEMVDCSPEAVEWANDIIEQQEKFANEQLKVRVYSSWE